VWAPRVGAAGRRSVPTALAAFPAAGPRRVLNGLRVLDLTWVLAGPYATKQLAEHGADVIKIESRHRQDPTRFAPSMRLREGAGFDDSGYFLNFNRNKRSVAVNMRTEDGRDLVRRLAQTSDVVIENFSPGGDMVAANAAVLAVLDLVSAGHGGYVDLSQLEAMAAAMGTAVLEAQRPQDCSADPRTAAYPNRHPAMCPRGVYPTRGDDRWIAIAVGDATAWRPLAGLTGSARLAPLAGHDLAARRRQEDLIDSQLAAWTSGQDGPELAARLQRAGVAAAVVNNGRDLVEADEQLAARGFYPVLEHPVAGPVRHEGIVIKLAGTPGALTTAAPLLGAHTDVVLTELLDLTQADLAELRDGGVLE